MNQTEIVENDVAQLANEIVFHTYRWNRVDVHKLFQNMSTLDYAAMWILSRHTEGAEENKKIYLKEMSEKLMLPMPKVSRLVQALQDKGLVYWRHDGKGEEGTYIQVTENGIKQAIRQQETLREFYNQVISRFGKERFAHLLEEMNELEEIMKEEMDKNKGTADSEK